MDLSMTNTICESHIPFWKKTAFSVTNKLKNNYLVGDRYLVIEEVGKGGFGIVFEAVDLASGSLVALKLEHRKKTKKYFLRLEYCIYKLLHSDWSYLDYYGEKCIPDVYRYISDSGVRIMVMELCSFSLETMFHNYNRSFSLSTVSVLAIKIINAIEFFHSKGLLHRDIKPANFVTSAGDQSKNLYLIDYGLASPYIDEFGYHKTEEEEVNFKGTDKYASVNSHFRKDISRRDDMESIGYLLLYFSTGVLPWMRFSEREDKRELYGICKRDTPIRILCSGLPGLQRKFSPLINMQINLKSTLCT
eukprot:TRINITY_DN5984_c0_g2_i2.p1 TRINITY_DN5984_c0_g2~~TRINITY_DN5984_c0_g2_i2.p1  ORF type:complete len:304 (-),score=48.11 TRINITY_DN5984_c0_g2_i2:302-1213(-)